MDWILSKFTFSPPEQRFEFGIKQHILRFWCLEESTWDQHSSLPFANNLTESRRATIEYIIDNIYSSVISCSWTCVASSWNCHKYLLQDQWKRSTFTTSFGVPNLENSIPMETRTCMQALQVFQSSARQLLGGAIELDGQIKNKKDEWEDINSIQHSLSLLTEAQAAMDLESFAWCTKVWRYQEGH